MNTGMIPVFEEKMLKKCKEEMGGQCCPHCGEEL